MRSDWPRWRCAATSPWTGRARCPTSADRGATEPLAALERHLDSTPHRVLIVAESEGRRESLLELLRDHRIEPPSVATLAEFEPATRRWPSPPRRWPQGFHWHEPTRAVPPCDPVRHRDRALSPARRRRGAGASRSRSPDVDALIKDLSELKVGDPVVHANHGIGRYAG
jgi:transcription-repair coupling factor (superfamily II helicase)